MNQPFGKDDLRNNQDYHGRSEFLEVDDGVEFCLDLDCGGVQIKIDAVMQKLQKYGLLMVVVMDNSWWLRMIPKVKKKKEDIF